MSDATFTFRVDEVLKNEFTTAAKARDRTAAQLLRDFMREFVQKQHEVAEHDAWFRREMQTGLDSANAGRLVPASEHAPRDAIHRRQRWLPCGLTEIERHAGRLAEQISYCVQHHRHSLNLSVSGRFQAGQQHCTGLYVANKLAISKDWEVRAYAWHSNSSLTRSPLTARRP